MRASEELLNKIVEFEGMKLTSYQCPAGVWTIGVGHTKGVKQGQKISREQAMMLLRCDLKVCEDEVNKLKGLSQEQFDATVDFCFNLGIKAFAGSTLRTKIATNAPVDEIQNEFRRWSYCKGKRLKGLAVRREWEAKLYKLGCG